ncbi:hypothetical protein [Bradyrhizobium sp. dw_78]|uniref:hypothetical protein n=1 Tax=Bradyrhizobium sp. dw_78 TaxID=2719793 RepID=UPI00201C3074|nr:hypothetical protein [Bradyrhizobium sp. dw_78]
MPDRTSQFLPPSWVRRAAAIAFLVVVAATGAAWPQTPPPSSPSAAPPPAGTQVQPQAAPVQPMPAQGEPAAPPPRENPGLISEIGKMFGRLPGLKSTSETIGDLNDRAKDATKGAADTLSNLAKPSMVSGRIVCPVSANGAPDCKSASDKLCQAKGFKEGKSLTMDSAETCSAKVLIPGRTRKPDDCRTDNYVTAALCQ